MKMLISIATFAIIGLIAGHLIAGTFIREWEVKFPTHPDLIYPREYVIPCYGVGLIGGAILGSIVGSVASAVSRRKD